MALTHAPVRPRPPWRALGSSVLGRGARARLHRLPAHWPLTLCIGGFPIWWALGLGALIWPLFAIPLAVRMITRRRRITVPVGFGAWLLYLGFVLLSYTALEGSATVPFAWLWRLANYVSCTIFFLAICEADEDEIGTDRIVRLLAFFWIITVAGGWLGVLMPYGGIPSLTERLLPTGMASNEFVQELVRPEFAQVHEILGYPLGRPKAPFIYTNDWGSVYALLLPFFFLSWLQAPDLRRRSWAYLLLLASLIPVFVSLNRGLWLSLGVALIYAASRSGELARMARRALLALVTVGMLLIVFTPVGTLVESRAENDHSSAGRSLLYGEAFRITADSPIIGLGGPRPYEGNKIIPMVGTQGLFWTVLVSTGYVGLLVFLAAWLRWIWETRAGPPVTFWCHVVLIIGLVQIFVYDLIPSALHLVFIAAALGFRAARQQRVEPLLGAAA
ncbi:MAG TPA: O-antigen ligase family protein [Iamia sp.]